MKNRTKNSPEMKRRIFPKISRRLSETLFFDSSGRPKSLQNQDCFINFGSLRAPFSLHLAPFGLNFGSILAPFWSSLASIWPPRASPWALWGPFGRQSVPKKGPMSETLVRWTPLWAPILEPFLVNFSIKFLLIFVYVFWMTFGAILYQF